MGFLASDTSASSQMKMHPRWLFFSLCRGIRTADVFIATAAVADWRPAKCAAKKLKKGQMSGVLRLVRNPDILKSARAEVKVGFAAETGDAVPEARRKCREKGLGMIVANDVTEKGAGFGTDTNRVVFLRADGTRESLPLMSKLAVAGRIVRECEGFCA